MASSTQETPNHSSPDHSSSDHNRLADLGYKVKSFVFHDSPRRAHSIAAQGGINAAQNYQNDGDSVHRLSYDTVHGGYHRSRAANLHPPADCSVQLTSQSLPPWFSALSSNRLATSFTRCPPRSF